MKKYARYLLSYRKWILMILIFLIVQAYCELALPGCAADIIDIGLLNNGAGWDADLFRPEELWEMGGKMLFYTVVMLFASIGAAYGSSRVGASVGRNLRARLFRRAVYGGEEAADLFASSRIDGCAEDVRKIQTMTAGGLHLFLYAPILGIGGVLQIWRMGSGMGWLFAASLFVALVFAWTLIGIAMPKLKKLRPLEERLALLARESLAGLKEMRAFGREEQEKERFDEENRRLTETELFANRTMLFLKPGMRIILYTAVFISMWVAARRIHAGSLQVGAMIAFLTYMMMVLASLLALAGMMSVMPQVYAAAEQVEDVLLGERSVPQKQESAALGSCRGVVAFSHVSFRYPGAEEDVLRDVDFVAEPGRTTAVIGSTGCGKSMLRPLLMRCCDATDGCITVDGRDIREWPPEELRSHILFGLRGKDTQITCSGDAEAAVILITQQIRTAMRADQILVLEEGRLVGKGTHRELLKHCEIYQQIAESQLDKRGA